MHIPTVLSATTTNHSARLTTQRISLTNAGMYACIAATPYASTNISATINVISKSTNTTH